jgi:hypothetical protein
VELIELCDEIYPKEELRERVTRERSIWIKRLSDAIEERCWGEGWNPRKKVGKESRMWIDKQRKLHKLGKLMEWKRRVLERVEFPFSPQKEVATNMGHAARLVKFYEEYGHYAPTMSYGGGALTHWVCELRETDGRVGIISDTPESAKEAIEYLKKNIRGFDMSLTVKETFNKLHGLTHNGYERSVVSDTKD